MVIGNTPAEKRSLELHKQEKAFRVKSDIFHHGLTKNTCVRGIKCDSEYDIITNSLGFRDKEIRDVPLVTEKYRIVLIGDSFTEGIGVDYEDTFAGLLDSKLSKRGIEVLNAGVVSYSPIIYWQKVKYLLEDVGLRFNKLIVFLDISDVFDEVELTQGGNGVRHVSPKLKMQKLGKGLKQFLKKNTTVTFGLSKKLYNISKAYRTIRLKNAWLYDEIAYAKYGISGLANMRLHMDRLKELLERNNIELAVVIYPWPELVIKPGIAPEYISFWQDWCDKSEVLFVNLFPYFIPDSYKEQRIFIDKYFIKGDIHFSEEGHKYVADLLSNANIL